MIIKPHRKNHYDYLNELLGLKDEDALKPGIPIGPAQQTKIIQQAQEKLAAFEAAAKSNQAEELEILNANILKIKFAIQMLEDKKKKKIYDQGLTLTTSILDLQSPKNTTTLVPLAPIDEIVNHFNDFINEQMQRKDAQGQPLFKDGDFKYEKREGNPTVHIFTFPDEVSADAFLGRLFTKNMAMLPNGSQDIEDLKQQRLRDEIQNMRPRPGGKCKPEEEEEAKNVYKRR